MYTSWKVACKLLLSTACEPYDHMSVSSWEAHSMSLERNHSYSWDSAFMRLIAAGSLSSPEPSLIVP